MRENANLDRTSCCFAASRSFFSALLELVRIDIHSFFRINSECGLKDKFRTNGAEVQSSKLTPPLQKLAVPQPSLQKNSRREGNADLH
jgi:hypothetical protein